MHFNSGYYKSLRGDFYFFNFFFLSYRNTRWHWNIACENKVQIDDLKFTCNKKSSVVTFIMEYGQLMQPDVGLHSEVQPFERKLFIRTSLLFSKRWFQYFSPCTNSHIV